MSANCIGEIDCNVKSKEKKPGFDTGAAGWEAGMLPLYYAAPKI